MHGARSLNVCIFRLQGYLTSRADIEKKVKRKMVDEGIDLVVQCEEEALVVENFFGIAACILRGRWYILDAHYPMMNVRLDSNVPTTRLL